MKIWGRGWGRYAALHRWAAPLVQGEGVWGADYTRALCSASIGLGLLSKLIPETSTTRTFEIPACRDISARGADRGAPGLRRGGRGGVLRPRTTSWSGRPPLPGESRRRIRSRPPGASAASRAATDSTTCSGVLAEIGELADHGPGPAALVRRLLPDAFWTLANNVMSVLGGLAVVKLVSLLVPAGIRGANLALGIVALLTLLIVNPVLTAQLRLYFDHARPGAAARTCGPSSLCCCGARA